MFVVRWVCDFTNFTSYSHLLQVFTWKLTLTSRHATISLVSAALLLHCRLVMSLKANQASALQFLIYMDGMSRVIYPRTWNTGHNCTCKSGDAFHVLEPSIQIRARWIGHQEECDLTWPRLHWKIPQDKGKERVNIQETASIVACSNSRRRATQQMCSPAYTVKWMTSETTCKPVRCGTICSVAQRQLNPEA